MTQQAAIEPIEFSHSALTLLMPMHAILSSTGHIIGQGSTLAKLSPEDGFIGSRFLERFELRRPRNVTRIAELGVVGGQLLNLRMRDHLDMPMKGIAIRLPGTSNILVNLSFGISVTEAVARFDLSSGDFSATDLTIEMLYLVEAKNAVMEETRNLNLRLQGAKIAAEEQAFTDTLTGLRNRRAMDMILNRYRDCGERFGLVHLDLDFFKQVNDTLGHAAGDHVLQAAAKILLDETRSEDTVIRCGGDEFVLIFHKLTDPEMLAGVARRILKRLEQPIMFDGTPCRISGSIGITISEDYKTPDPEQMLIDADIALYASKNAGRAQHTFARDAGVIASSKKASDGQPAQPIS